MQHIVFSTSSWRKDWGKTMSSWAAFPQRLQEGLAISTSHDHVCLQILAGTGVSLQNKLENDGKLARNHSGCVCRPKRFEAHVVLCLELPKSLRLIHPSDEEFAG